MLESLIDEEKNILSENIKKLITMVIKLFML